MTTRNPSGARGGRILVDQSVVFSRVGDRRAIGNAGEILIDTAVLEVRNGAQLTVSSLGQGNAGDVRITADRVLFQNGDAISRVAAGAVGKGGDIVIRAGVVEVRDGGQLLANSLGQGDAGSVRIEARDRVRFQGESAALSSVGDTGIGNGGDVVIETTVLEVLDGAQLVAATQGLGNPGSVKIAASDRVSFQGFSRETGRVSGVFVLQATDGDRLPSQPDGPQRTGDIDIRTNALTLSDGAVLDARTINQRPGGNINLTVGRLDLLAGGQIISASEVNGPAGNITIQADRSIQVSGTDPQFAERVALLPVTDQFVVPQSTISVRSRNLGTAGNITLKTPLLLLSDRGQLIAESNATQGGNITLDLGQALVMRNGSLISATAGLAQGAGDGGNIIVAAPFVLSLPNDNNDIIANAFSGTGGNITINAQAILNFTLNDKGKTFDQLRRQGTNDISASSDFGSNGVLDLTGLNVDPAQGIAPLPSSPGIPQPAQGCQPALASSQTAKAELFTTGRGGLPPSPIDPLASSDILDDLRIPAALVAQGQRSTQSAFSPVTQTLAAPVPKVSTDLAIAIVEATHWHLDSQGRAVLSATALGPKPTKSCHLTGSNRRS